MNDDDEGPQGTRVLSPDGPQTRARDAAMAAVNAGHPPHGLGGGVNSPLATQPTEVIDTAQWNLEAGGPHRARGAPSGSSETGGADAAGLGSSGSGLLGRDPYGAPPPGPGRINLPTDPGKERSGWSPQLVTIVVIAAVVIAGGTFALVLLLSKPSGSTSSSGSTTAAASAAPPPTTTGIASVAPPAAPPSASADPLPEADAQAKAALEKLVPGLVECAEKKIHALPGGSPAVPDTFGWLKTGAYPATEQNWNNHFFVCTSFRVLGPMPFVFQWQVDKPGVQGTALVWIDADADGKPDRAYAFTATMEGKDKLTVGPIGPADASRKLAVAPRAF